MSFDLYIDLEELGGGGGGWVELDYSVSSGPFLTMNFEFDHDHGPRPGPELDNCLYTGGFLMVKMSREKYSREKPMVENNFYFLVDIIKPNGPMVNIVTRYSSR